MYRMMVVDDELKLLEGLCSYYPWAELGFEIVKKVENGRQALDYLEHETVDVVLTDVSMPVMTGLELAERLAGRKEIKVVILSGYADFKYAQTAIKYGVKDYLLKPVKAEEIHQVFVRLREELDRERVGLSSGYLSTFFKQETGTTFSDYILAEKMRRAKELLLQIRYKTYDVAEILGYENPKNFSRAFRMYYGMSPREFRRQEGVEGENR